MILKKLLYRDRYVVRVFEVHKQGRELITGKASGGYRAALPLRPDYVCDVCDLTEEETWWHRDAKRETMTIAAQRTYEPFDDFEPARRVACHYAADDTRYILAREVSIWAVSVIWKFDAPRRLRTASAAKSVMWVESFPVSFSTDEL